MELQFQCSICGDASSKICIYCTKDACGKHLCLRCRRCSDCCQCDMPAAKDDPVEVMPVEEPVPSAISSEV